MVPVVSAQAVSATSRATARVTAARAGILARSPAPPGWRAASGCPAPRRPSRPPLARAPPRPTPGPGRTGGTEEGGDGVGGGAGGAGCPGGEGEGGVRQGTELLGVEVGVAAGGQDEVAVRHGPHVAESLQDLVLVEDLREPGRPGHGWR